jgi:hypothetical protein
VRQKTSTFVNKPSVTEKVGRREGAGNSRTGTQSAKASVAARSQKTMATLTLLNARRTEGQHRVPDFNYFRLAT